MVGILNVSRSGYYSWLNRKPSKRAVTDMVHEKKIREAHSKSRLTYGPNRIKTELAENGIMIGRDHISRLMKRMGLKCIQKRKYKYTTDSRHNLPTYPNLLNQEFNVYAPGQAWGSDITYISTEEGWLYLAGIKDFGSKEIVGWATNSRMTRNLVKEALSKALAFRTPEKDCIHHSDRGKQYCSEEYIEKLRAHGFLVSMSRKGNCYDNAPTESFWGFLKQELIYRRKFKTRKEAIAAIQEYIEIFYNRVRRHSAISNMAPSIFTEKYYKERKSA